MMRSRRSPPDLVSRSRSQVLRQTTPDEEIADPLTGPADANSSGS
jgi:hypothetical protein